MMVLGLVEHSKLKRYGNDIGKAYAAHQLWVVK